MAKKRLRKSEIRDLNSMISGFEISKKDKVEVDDGLVFVNDECLFFYFEDKLVPSLRLLLRQDLLKIVVVDVPAVKFLVNGADVMRPGIVRIDESIEKGDFVCVKDENYSKPVCVCVALFSGSEMKAVSNGKVLKNIHYVGDAVWNAK